MFFQMCPHLLCFLLLLCVPDTHSAKCPEQCVCDQIQLTVTCNSKNLTHIPPTLDEITVKLDLRGNDIQELPSGAFNTHRTSHTCRCSAESFDGLSSLKQLLIDRNRVEEIQPGAFSQLGFLNLLSLTHNQLVYMPNMAFQALAGLFTLTRLSLDHNELQLPEVTRLDLSYNPMTYLGEEVVSMNKLTHLFMDHMSLQDLDPTAFSKSSKLVHLDLGHNQLRNLEAVHPPELRCQSQEAMLRAEREEAARITPPPTQEPKNKVKCPANCVCEADTHHSSCENRAHTKVPRGFSPDTRLLDLRETTSTSSPAAASLAWPRWFRSTCSAARSWRWRMGPHVPPPGEEPLHRFPPGSLQPGAQPAALHLENNSISRLEADVLLGAGSLRSLYLTGNAIGNVSPRALEGAGDLDTLHLGGNKLKEVPTEAFSKMGSLRDLRLSGNTIRWGNLLEEVPDLHPLSSLEVINLAHNPLMCDCPLLPLRMWIEKVNLKVRATCANPPELIGRRVKDVQVFRACPGGESLPSPPTVNPKPAKAPKATKPKPMHLKGPRRVKMLKAKRRKGSNTKPTAAKKTTERHSMA
ncbi:hypothetical protein F7725_013962 [Dissostichus mawsoni]|uniref:Chondroadherin-like protein n=1 Tax=Dissostichus mawsoni TaxID=36200 RepID=A0A7J5YUK9_DISMA|nr:hypothetical protein F7725_013962 [Dissostichus mawsoni]